MVETPDPIDVIAEALADNGYGYWVDVSDVAQAAFDALTKAGFQVVPIVEDEARQEVEELVADKKRHVRDDPLGLAEANERLVSADTGDFEACDVCDAIEDICVIHAAEGVGSAQMTQLLRFVLDEPEGAWGWMQETERRRATCRESEAAYLGRSD